MFAMTMMPLGSLLYNNVHYAHGVRFSMRSVTFTEFRKDASALFSAVEEGETIQVVRHGKPIAEISPLKNTTDNLPSWKKKRIRQSIKGEALSSLILGEREST